MSYSEQSLINPCCLHTQSRLRRRGIDHIVAIANKNCADVCQTPFNSIRVTGINNVSLYC